MSAIKREREKKRLCYQRAAQKSNRCASCSRFGVDPTFTNVMVTACSKTLSKAVLLAGCNQDIRPDHFITNNIFHVAQCPVKHLRKECEETADLTLAAQGGVGAIPEWRMCASHPAPHLLAEFHTKSVG